MNPVILLLHIIPQNMISYLVGWVVRLRFPSTMQKWLNKRFVGIFNINMAEAEKDLSEYRTIEDVFTRALKPGERNIDAHFCSPADGTLSSAGPVDGDTAIQAKGFFYEASDLATGTQRDGASSPFNHYLTVYLAPYNYHRVHSPVAGAIKNIYYIPGELWPVNQLSIRNVPKVFTRNERLSFEIESEKGGRCFVVMVGAFNVGRMRSPLLENFHTNDRFFKSPRFQHFQFSVPRSIKAGDELGTFMLGSTVVLVMDEMFSKSYKPLTNQEPRNIKLGESISL